MRRIGLISDVASALLQGKVYEPVCKFKAICDYTGSVMPNSLTMSSVIPSCRMLLNYCSCVGETAEMI